MTSEDSFGLLKRYEVLCSTYCKAAFQDFWIHAFSSFPEIAGTVIPRACSGGLKVIYNNEKALITGV